MSAGWLGRNPSVAVAFRIWVGVRSQRRRSYDRRPCGSRPGSGSMKSVFIAANLTLVLAAAPGLAVAQGADSAIPAPPDISTPKTAGRGPVEIVVSNIRKSLGHVR